jgi:hypothetical protein
MRSLVGAHLFGFSAPMETTGKKGNPEASASWLDLAHHNITADDQGTGWFSASPAGGAACASAAAHHVSARATVLGGSLSCQAPNAPKRWHSPCHGAAARSPAITCARSQSSPAEAGKRIHLGDVSTMKQGSQLFRLFLR